MTTLVLLVTAIVNLFSKQYATIYGISVTIAFFLIFTISEQSTCERENPLPTITHSKNSISSSSRG